MFHSIDRRLIYSFIFSPIKPFVTWNLVLFSLCRWNYYEWNLHFHTSIYYLKFFFSASHNVVFRLFESWKTHFIQRKKKKTNLKTLIFVCLFVIQLFQFICVFLFIFITCWCYFFSQLAACWIVHLLTRIIRTPIHGMIFITCYAIDFLYVCEELFNETFKVYLFSIQLW